MEIGVLVAELVNLTLNPIRKRWRNHRGIGRYMTTLNEKLEELNARKQDRDLKMKADLLPGKTPKKEVELWFTKVEKINREVTAIKQRVLIMKFFERAKLGNKVVKKIRELEELYQKGVFLDGLVESMPEFGDCLPTTRLGENVTSKRKTDEIWACLTSDEFRKIAVYGMAGIGKTTAMKHINNRVLESKAKFESVIWVTVSKASDVFKLQGAIACKLGLDISRHEDETSRAGKLHAALTLRKRHVLILDDLWEVHRLEDVGIPEPTLENGCKLALTTRSFEVCRGMSCESIRMELLTEREARDLFWDVVGRGVLRDPNLEAIGAEFVKECGRLPLAIITIGGSLKGVDEYCDWKTSLEEFKTYMKGGSTVIEQLKFSYLRLSDKRLKDCLMYCVLYPEDARIYREELIEYLVDEGIITGIKSRGEGFERGHAILNKLENACLLEGSTNDFGAKYVKMHDLVRDMLLQISSADPKFMVEAGVGLRAIPSEGKWAGDLLRVSLTRNNILDIPSSESPRCPTLATLMLNYNKLQSIAECFFAHMKGLGVLDLSYTSIERLPESVSDLVNLTSLLLRRCQKLKYVPPLAKLKALKRLDLSYTRIDEVPRGMEVLFNLRYLNLDTQSLENLPDGILPNLSNLQCLLLCDKMSTRLKVRGHEITQLTKLETFKGRLYDIKDFNTYVKCSGERRAMDYWLHVGHGMYMDDRDVHKYKKAVILLPCEMSESLHVDQYPLLLPKDVELLIVMRHGLGRSLCTTAQLNHAAHLRSCTLISSPSIICLLYSTSCTVPLLQSLADLHLEGLQNLQWMIKQERGDSTILAPSIFSSLRKISIQFCPKLKSLFTPLMVLSSLQNLEEIYVKHCDQMSRIVGSELDQYDVEETRSTTITLPKLRVLELWGLPELESICNITESMVADSVQEISIWNCPKLRNIPFLDRTLCPRSVRQIDVHKQWWESLKWQCPDSKEALQPFCIFWTQ